MRRSRQSEFEGWLLVANFPRSGNSHQQQRPGQHRLGYRNAWIFPVKPGNSALAPVQTYPLQPVCFLDDWQWDDPDRPGIGYRLSVVVCQGRCRQRVQTASYKATAGKKGPVDPVVWPQRKVLPGAQWRPLNSQGRTVGDVWNPAAVHWVEIGSLDPCVA